MSGPVSPLGPIEAVATAAAAAPGAAYSQAIAAGHLVATAGQVGRHPDGTLADGFEAQVERAIENLRAVLEAAGTDLAHVVKTTCFLADVGQFRAFDAVYRRHFAPPYPARSTFGVALAPPLLFEIEAWAVRPGLPPAGPADAAGPGKE